MKYYIVALENDYNCHMGCRDLMIEIPNETIEDVQWLANGEHTNMDVLLSDLIEKVLEHNKVVSD